MSEALNIFGKLYIPYCAESSGKVERANAASNSSYQVLSQVQVIFSPLSSPPSEPPCALPTGPFELLSGRPFLRANTPRPRLYWLGTYHASPFYDSFSVHMLTILDNRCPYTSRYNCSQTCPMLPRGQSTPQTALS